MSSLHRERCFNADVVEVEIGRILTEVELQRREGTRRSHVKRVFGVSRMPQDRSR